MSVPIVKSKHYTLFRLKNGTYWWTIASDPDLPTSGWAFAELQSFGPIRPMNEYQMLPAISPEEKVAIITGFLLRDAR